MTVEEAKAAAVEIWDIGLYGAVFMNGLTAEQVAAAANGIGPESWSPEARAKLDKWLSTFRLAAVVHDCRFTYDNDGTRPPFDAANNELENNCLILANHHYAWYNPMRYLARHAAHIVADACRDFGWDDWRKAYQKSRSSSSDRASATSS